MLNLRAHAALPLAFLTTLAASWTACAGPLDPPSGAIQSTGKTIAEVEPRIAINAANTPGDADSLFKITQPGSYYLPANVVGVAGPKKIGIEITANQVTVDLNGFVIDGAGQLNTGVLVAGTMTCVRNGSVRNLTVGRGVWITNQAATLEDLRLSDTAGVGVDVDAEHATLRRINIQFAIGGIDASAGDHASITDCAVVKSYDFGIRAGVGTLIDRCSVNDPVLLSGAVVGIQAGSDSVIRSSQVWMDDVGVNARGILVSSKTRVQGCSIRTNSTGAAAIAVTGVGCVLMDNDMTGSDKGAGVNLVVNSGKTRVEGNTISNYEQGVAVNNTVFNVIIRNCLAATPTPIQFASDTNTIMGPQVTTTTDTSLTNPLANLVY